LYTKYDGYVSIGVSVFPTQIHEWFCVHTTADDRQTGTVWHTDREAGLLFFQYDMWDISDLEKDVGMMVECLGFCLILDHELGEYVCEQYNFKS
jgi:hypothetical protein